MGTWRQTIGETGGKFDRPRNVPERQVHADQPTDGTDKSVHVRFLQSNTPYAPGDIASFPERVAYRLAEEGQAEVLDADQ